MSDIVPTPPEPRPLPFRRPADYYAAPPSEVRPLFPRAVPFGCGAASIAAIAVLFGVGAFAGSGKAGKIFGMLLGTMAGEIHGMFSKEVTRAQRDAFESEMKALEQNVADGKVPMDRLQPLMRTIRDASSDNSVTPKEAETLTKAAREVNDGVGRSRGREVSEPRHPETPKPRDAAIPR